MVGICSNGTWCSSHHVAHSEFPGGEGGVDEPGEEFTVGVRFGGFERGC